MGNKQKTYAILLALLASFSTLSLADDDVHYSVGAKLWKEKLTLSDLHATESANISQPILSFGVRKGAWFGSLGVIPNKRHEFNDGTHFNDFDKRDIDIFVGRYVWEGLGIGLNYKDSNIKAVNGSSNLSVLYAAFVFSKQIKDSSAFVYTTGAMQVSGSYSDNRGTGGASLNNGVDNAYQMEIGLGYRIDPKMSFTIGYRAQALKVGAGTHDGAKEKASGVLAGVAYTF